MQLHYLHWTKADQRNKQTRKVNTATVENTESQQVYFTDLPKIVTDASGVS